MLEVVPGGGVDAVTLASLRTLWWAAFDDFTEDDADHALDRRGGLHVLLRLGDLVVAHAAAVPRTVVVGDLPLAAGYVEAVATLPDHQGRGHGTRVVTRLGEELRARFALGVLSTGEHGFYERLGWRRWRGPSSVLTADGGRHRTEEDDDGLMVLTWAATADLDLASPIACHDRPGDAW